MALRRSPLWQAAFKLDWADEMFANALNLANRFIQAGNYGFREERDESGARVIFYCERLPKELPLAIGSGIHSLRSALDAAVSALMEGVTGKPLERVNFPFHQTERELRAEFEPRVSHCGSCGGARQTKAKLHELSEHLPELVDLIFNHFKPWQGGNKALWSLNKLDNFQKHRMLLLTVAAVRGGVDYVDSAMPLSSFKGNEWTITSGTQQLIAQSRAKIIETGDRRLDINFKFSGNIPYAGDPVFAVLEELYALVRNILITILNRFEGHKALT